MSRGMGRVQKRIFAAFEDAEHPAFDTNELCRIVYQTEIVEKNHRVSVLRALKALAMGPFSSLWQWVPEFEKTDTVWYDYRRLPARGRGRRPAARRRSDASL